MARQPRYGTSLCRIAIQQLNRQGHHHNARLHHSQNGPMTGTGIGTYPTWTLPYDAALGSATASVSDCFSQKQSGMTAGLGSR
jgi:hypothetical protein